MTYSKLPTVGTYGTIKKLGKDATQLSNQSTSFDETPRTGGTYDSGIDLEKLNKIREIVHNRSPLATSDLSYKITSDSNKLGRSCTEGAYGMISTDDYLDHYLIDSNRSMTSETIEDTYLQTRRIETTGMNP